MLDRADASEQIATIVRLPAFAYDKHLTVFASNSLARALAPDLSAGTNIARALFLSDRPHQLSARSWASACALVSDALRASLDAQGEDEAFISIVGELAALSMDFNLAWADTLSSAPGDQFELAAGPGGEITFTFRQAVAADASGDTVVTMSPADDVSAARLHALVAAIL